MSGGLRREKFADALSQNDSDMPHANRPRMNGGPARPNPLKRVCGVPNLLLEIHKRVAERSNRFVDLQTSVGARIVQ
jgi:hypothetical protein